MKDAKEYFIGKRVRCRVIESTRIDVSLDTAFHFVRVEIDGSAFNAAFECDRDGNPVVATGAVFDADIAESAFSQPPFGEKSCFMFDNIKLITGMALFDHIPQRRLRFPD